MQVDLRQGDCLEVLKTLPDNSIDAIVTDPPYGLSKQPDMQVVLEHWLNGDDYEHRGGGFMGQKWDSFVPGPSVWRECLRVLKPGGHLLAFAGSRTSDLMGLSIRLSGFEMRDQIQWLYGNGMPKGMNVGKAMDKAGIESEGDWHGWNTSLKPAHEPIIMARKPLKGTVAKNVATHGTGALNIEATRVGTTKDVPASISRHAAREDGVYEGNRDGSWGNEVGGPGSGHDPNTGRWPANVILDEDAAAQLDAETKHLKVGGSIAPDSKGARKRNNNIYGEDKVDRGEWEAYGDSGGASRFFYCAKASKAERNNGGPNPHTTVKPVDLMKYLCRLVTPEGGIVLDPFMGSGTTGMACVVEGFNFIGVDLEAEYVDLAQRRIEAVT